MPAFSILCQPSCGSLPAAVFGGGLFVELFLRSWLLGSCQQGIYFFARPAAHGVLHPAGNLTWLAALRKLCIGKLQHFFSWGALGMFWRAHNHCNFAQQLVGQLVAVFQSAYYKFLMFLGQFPAHCQFAGAENACGLSKAFLEAILALKKDERPRHMGKSGKQSIAA